MAICPLCDGTGKLVEKWETKAESVKRLRMRGLTIRQIMKVFGWKTPSHVVYYLKKALEK